MCDIRTKCVTLNKEYSDVLQVPDNANVLEEFVIRDVAKNLVVATEVGKKCSRREFSNWSYSRNMLDWKVKLNN